MIVFIDANIYVSLLSRPDLTDIYFDKINTKINAKKIEILFPFTTQSEVKRNIDKEVADNKKRKVKKVLQSPDEWFKEEWEEFIERLEKKLDKDKDIFQQNASKLLNRVINELRLNSSAPNETTELMNSAYLRKGKGYPPGKPSDHIGDQLAWEIILDKYVDSDVVIISQDPDWQNFDSEDDKPKLNYLLQKEWDEKCKNKKEIKLYKSIGQFLEKEFKETNVSKKEKEEEKEVSALKPSMPSSFHPSVGTVTVVEPFIPFPGSAYFGSAPVSGPSIGRATFSSEQFSDKSGWCYDCSVWFRILPVSCPSCGRALLG